MMEANQIVELMKAVSENGLTDFSYEENGVVLKIKKHPEKKIVAPAAAVEYVQTAAMPQVQAEVDGIPVNDGAGSEQISRKYRKKSVGRDILFRKRTGCSALCTGR